MNETVLTTIAGLAEKFDPNPIPISRFKLDEPFLHALNLLRTVAADQRDAKFEKAYRFFRESRRYSLNISTLLYNSIHFLTHWREDETVRWDFSSRLTLDLEQILTNTRSFLDSTYRLVLEFSTEKSLVPGVRRKSFGKFAEWAAKDQLRFQSPLSFMTELVPWGLTIKKMRDDYIHRGYEATPFWDNDDAYFYPYLFNHKDRRMPDLFYRSSSTSETNKPIYLRKFLVYATAPVIALELTLGRYLVNSVNSMYVSTIDQTLNCPFKANPHLDALYAFICQNRECLDTEIFKHSYFSS